MSLSDLDTTSKPKKYARVAQVRNRYGDCSDMWLTRKMREEGFPAPVFFGGRDRFWQVEDLDAWDALMIQRGRQSTPVPSPRNQR
ncbi:putative DNA-binding transcriptional regulator AlpA [Bradyrhizobium sp. AZCC 2262]|uniref:helix-turn-helix transcriptional regulator n=1 Tax=Bradyrhizobium sp. AZCC 2262 TaxID=3117022 RepID=UPI002FF2F623